MQETIVNRVANSGLVSLDLENYYPTDKFLELDMAQALFQGIILREKDFRIWVKEHDWTKYQDAQVAIYCSADAIVPAWAYMIVATQLGGYASRVHQGTLTSLVASKFLSNVQAINWKIYEGAKVVVKGCSNKEVPESVYTEVAFQLQALASSIMYGEPCSTVPVYKTKKQKADK